jgi:hypothetical protein
MGIILLVRSASHGTEPMKQLKETRAIHGIQQATGARAKAKSKSANDEARLNTNRVAAQVAQGTYAAAGARTAERLVAERRAAAKIAATALRDQME